MRAATLTRSKSLGFWSGKLVLWFLRRACKTERKKSKVLYIQQMYIDIYQSSDISCGCARCGREPIFALFFRTFKITILFQCIVWSNFHISKEKSFCFGLSRTWTARLDENNCVFGLFCLFCFSTIFIPKTKLSKQWKIFDSAWYMYSRIFCGLFCLAEFAFPTNHQFSFQKQNCSKKQKSCDTCDEAREISERQSIAVHYHCCSFQFI